MDMKWETVAFISLALDGSMTVLPQELSWGGAFRTGKEKELPPLGHTAPIRSYTAIGVRELWGTGYSWPMEEVAIRAKMGK